MKKNWCLTDPDCAQYMCNDGTNYELIQYLWLDRTQEDKQEGLCEYCIVHAEVDMNDVEPNEIESAISAYGYALHELRIGLDADAANQLIAECILKEQCLRGSVIADANTEEEAEEFIKKWIEEN